MPITKRIAKISLSLSLLGLVGASPFSLADDTTPVSELLRSGYEVKAAGLPGASTSRPGSLSDLAKRFVGVPVRDLWRRNKATFP